MNQMNSHCELKMPQHKPPEPRASQIRVSVHIDQLNIAHVDPSSKNRCAKQDGHLGDPKPRFDCMKDLTTMTINSSQGCDVWGWDQMCPPAFTLKHQKHVRPSRGECTNHAPTDPLGLRLK